MTLPEIESYFENLGVMPEFLYPKPKGGKYSIFKEYVYGMATYKVQITFYKTQEPFEVFIEWQLRKLKGSSLEERRHTILRVVNITVARFAWKHCHHEGFSLA
jgi:hypothetical protein